jgi:hypothetical protein
MIKYGFWLMVICFGMACTQSAMKNSPASTKQKAATCNGKPIPIDKMITPGGGIGRVTISENADSTVIVLGKPDSGDAAMGARLMTWYDKHDTSSYQINVYSHRNMGAADENIAHVRAIRVTSPAFILRG